MTVRARQKYLKRSAYMSFANTEEPTADCAWDLQRTHSRLSTTQMG